MANPLVLSNGAPVPMHELSPENVTAIAYLLDKQRERQRLRSHNWKIKGDFLSRPQGHHVTASHQLIVFHYVTRSRDDFFNRKARITQQDFQRNISFATSMITAEDGTRELTDAWLDEIIKKMGLNAVSDGVCASALRACYADAARNVAQRLRRVYRQHA